MALSDAVRQAIWQRTLSSEIGYPIDRPTPIAADNQGSIFLAVNPVHDRRTKHIDIRYHFIREHLEEGAAELYFVRTANQLADILTKALPAKRHKDLVTKLGLI